jgi:hypothetical protein
MVVSPCLVITMVWLSGCCESNCIMSSNGNLWKVKPHYSAPKYLSWRLTLCNLLMKSSEFLIWYFDCPIRGQSRPAKYFASSHVGEPIQFTVGLRGTFFLYYLGSSYNLGGTEACDVSLSDHLFAVADFFMWEAICLSTIEVRSEVSFL